MAKRNIHKKRRSTRYWRSVTIQAPHVKTNYTSKIKSYKLKGMKREGWLLNVKGDKFSTSFIFKDKPTKAQMRKELSKFVEKNPTIFYH